MVELYGCINELSAVGDESNLSVDSPSSPVHPERLRERILLLSESKGRGIILVS